MSFFGDLLTLEVPCEASAPGRVRQALAAVHDGGWSLDDGLLIASELVTNAVRHSGCGAEHSVRVDVSHHGKNLLISVLDPGLSGDAVKRDEREASRPGGLGLLIIQRLSVRWGTARRDGYRVWAELPARPAAF